MYTNYKLSRDRKLLVAAFNDAAASRRLDIPQITSRRVKIEMESETTALVEITLPVSKKVRLSFRGHLNIRQNDSESVRTVAMALLATVENTFARSSVILALNKEIGRAVQCAQEAMADEWSGYSHPVLAVEPSPIHVGTGPEDSIDVVLRDWDQFLEPVTHVFRARDASEAVRLYAKHANRRVLVGMRAESVRSAGASGLIAESTLTMLQHAGLVAEEVYGRLLTCGDEGLTLQTDAGNLRLYYSGGLVTCQVQISEGICLDDSDLHFAHRPDWLDDAREYDRIGDFVELPGIDPDTHIVSIIKSSDSAIIGLDDDELHFWGGAAATRAEQDQVLKRIAA